MPVGVSGAFFRPSKSSMDSLIFVVRALWVDAFVGFHLGLFGGDIFLQHQSTEEAIQAARQQRESREAAEIEREAAERA